MVSDEADLPLEASGQVLLGRQPVGGGPLHLRHDLISAGHKRLNKVLPIGGLEVPAIWKQKKGKS